MRRSNRILLADDEPTFLKTTADLLRLRGYECRCTASAEEAVAELRKNRYNLLISDIQMPGNDGLDLIRRVPQIAGAMPVILVTAYPSVDSAVLSIDMPVAAYLIKPVDYDELWVRVERCMTWSRVQEVATETRRELSAWAAHLDQMQSLAGARPGMMSGEPMRTFVDANLSGVARTLSQFGRLADTVAENFAEPKQWEAVSAAQLDSAYRMLVEAVAVLEQTKEAFHSRTLARLRRKMQAVIDGWVVKRNEGSGQSAA